MNTDTAELEILDMGLEDITGLYEIIWRFNTVWPAHRIGSKYLLADETLRGLLSGGAVTLIRQRFGGHDTAREVITTEEAERILSSPVAWYPSLPDDPKVQIGYATTAVGGDRYRKLYEKTKMA